MQSLVFDWRDEPAPGDGLPEPRQHDHVSLELMGNHPIALTNAIDDVVRGVVLSSQRRGRPP
jgi:hypothetical protein